MPNGAHSEFLDAPPVTAPGAPSRKSLARRAGLLYLLACLPAPFALLYVPSRIFVAGDATATADRIRESETMLRLAVAVEFCSQYGLVLPSWLRASAMFSLPALRSPCRRLPGWSRRSPWPSARVSSRWGFGCWSGARAMHTVVSGRVNGRRRRFRNIRASSRPAPPFRHSQSSELWLSCASVYSRINGTS